MKRILIFFLAFSAIFLSQAQNQIPCVIPYQGTIADNLNVPYNGTYDFQFRLKDEFGTVLYNSGITSRNVVIGAYSVVLGENPLPLLPANLIKQNDTLYLEISFNDGVNGLQVLSPDVKLLPVPFALRAKIADAVCSDSLRIDTIISKKIRVDTILVKTICADTLKTKYVLADTIKAELICVDSIKIGSKLVLNEAKIKLIENDSLLKAKTICADSLKLSKKLVLNEAKIQKLENDTLNAKLICVDSLKITKNLILENAKIKSLENDTLKGKIICADSLKLTKQLQLDEATFRKLMSDTLAAKVACIDSLKIENPITGDKIIIQNGEIKIIKGTTEHIIREENGELVFETITGLDRLKMLLKSLEKAVEYVSDKLKFVVRDGTTGGTAGFTIFPNDKKMVVNDKLEVEEADPISTDKVSIEKSEVKLGKGTNSSSVKGVVDGLLFEPLKGAGKTFRMILDGAKDKLGFLTGGILGFSVEDSNTGGTSGFTIDPNSNEAEFSGSISAENSIEAPIFLNSDPITSFQAITSWNTSGNIFEFEAFDNSKNNSVGIELHPNSNKIEFNGIPNFNAGIETPKIIWTDPILTTSQSIFSWDAGGTFKQKTNKGNAQMGIFIDPNPPGIGKPGIDFRFEDNNTGTDLVTELEYDKNENKVEFKVRDNNTNSSTGLEFDLENKRMVADIYDARDLIQTPRLQLTDPITTSSQAIISWDNGGGLKQETKKGGGVAICIVEPDPTLPETPRLDFRFIDIPQGSDLGTKLEYDGNTNTIRFKATDNNTNSSTGFTFKPDEFKIDLDGLFDAESFQTPEFKIYHPITTMQQAISIWTGNTFQNSFSDGINPPVTFSVEPQFSAVTYQANSFGFNSNGVEMRQNIFGRLMDFSVTDHNNNSTVALIFDTQFGQIGTPGLFFKGGGSFKIDHPLDPLNKYLYHSFVESPDMMNIYNGNISTDANGIAEVQLPDYFLALNKDYRYQLTVMGKSFARAIVWEEVDANGIFIIKTDQPNVKVSWQVTGIRQDKFANENRIIPEVEKPESQKGKLMH